MNKYIETKSCEYETYSLKKYYRTTMTDLRIVWEFGRKSHSLWHVTTALAIYMAKLGIYAAATLFHAHGLMVSTRSNPPSQAEARRFDEVMREIAAAKVPGLDGGA